MVRRAPRQTRLDAPDEDETNLERWANFHVLRRGFLSATALSSFAYCNVKPFIDRLLAQLGLDAQTADMRAGAAAHEELQGALTDLAAPSALTFSEALRRREFLLQAELPLKDDRRMLRGIADLAFASRGEAYLLELKNARPPQRPDPTWKAPVGFEHGLQVQFYGLLARPLFGRTPRLALTYLLDRPRHALMEDLGRSRDPERALHALFSSSIELHPGPEAHELVNRLIREFRRAEKRRLIPTPTHGQPARCGSCRVRLWCPRRLDEPGRYERLAAGLLEKPAG